MIRENDPVSVPKDANGLKLQVIVYNIICMPSKTSIYIGNQLQSARRSKNLTQAEVAKRAGTNVNYYAKIERGESIPSLKMLEKIVKALGIRSSDVLPF